MHRSQLFGLVLWRTGLLIVAGYSVWRVARQVLRFVDLPAQLETGLGFIVTGAVFVVVSLVAERVMDRKHEGTDFE